MGVCAIRIDERLIHGQVATLWQGSWNCNRIMVIDTKSANDPMLKSVLKIACPTGVRLSVLEPDTAAANLQSGKYGKERITIVTKTPGNLLRLIDQGYHLESDITVGNMSGGSGNLQAHLGNARGYRGVPQTGRHAVSSLSADCPVRNACSLYETPRRRPGAGLTLT